MARRGSFPLPVLPSQQPYSFQTLSVRPSQSSVHVNGEIDIVLVHGLHSSSASYEKRVNDIATSIQRKVTGSRVHIFAFDGARMLLYEGKPFLENVVGVLLRQIRKLKARKRVATVAYSFAAFVVREAIVQSQYDRFLESVPVALVELIAPDGAYSSQSDWDELLANLMPKQEKGKSVGKEGLGHKSVVSIEESFETFRRNLDSSDDPMPVLQVEIKPEFRRRSSSAKSKWSVSSTAPESLTGKLPLPWLPDDELNRVSEFLGKAAKASPTPILTYKRPLSKIDPPNDRVYDDIVPFASHQSPRIVPAHPIDEKISSTGHIHVFGSWRRTESPDPIYDRVPSHVPKDIADRFGRPNLENIHEENSQEIALDEKGLEKSKTITLWYIRKGNWKEAERMYRALISNYRLRKPIDSNFHRLRLYYAQILFIQGDYGRSEKDLRNLEKERASRPEGADEPSLTSDIMQWLALSQWKQGRYSEAESTLKKGTERIQGQPNVSTSFLNLRSTHALVLASIGSLKEAWKLSLESLGRGNNDVKSQEFRQRSLRLFNHARISFAVGKLEEAYDMSKKALDGMNICLRPKHAFALEVAAFQASVLVAKGQTMQASETILRIIQEMKDTLSGDHPSTLQALETLVLVFRNEGRYSDAEATAAYLVHKNKHIRGEDHPQTLKSMSILAEIHLACGKWSDAEVAQRGVLQKAMDAKDPDTLGKYFYTLTLASILRKRGKWAEAREMTTRLLFEQLHHFQKEPEKEEPDNGVKGLFKAGECVSMHDLWDLINSSKSMTAEVAMLPVGLKSVQQSSNPVHGYPPIIQALHCLALCEQVRENADLSFAGGVLEMVRNIQISRLGTNHYLTVDVQYDMAVNKRLQGKLQDSLQKISDVMRYRQETFGVDHPDYLVAKHERAVILLELGKVRQALAEQQWTLERQEYLLGRFHPSTVSSRYTLSQIHHSLKQHEHAGRLLEEAIEGYRQIYGDNHPIVLRAYTRLVFLHLDRQDFSKATHLREKLAKEHSLGDDRGLRLAQCHHAYILQTLNRYEEALAICQELSRPSNEDSHSDVDFEVRTTLASSYFGLGKYEEAEKIQRQVHNEVKKNESQETSVGSVITAKFNLALTIKTGSPDRLEEACQLLTQAIDIARTALGPTHPQTKEMEATLRTWKTERNGTLVTHTPRSEDPHSNIEGDRTPCKRDSKTIPSMV